MSKKYIIAIVGMPGAGKSEASDFFKRKNIPVVRFGEITDEALTAKGLPLTQEHEKAFREEIRKNLGMAAFAIKSEDKIKSFLAASDMVILDGLRSYEEYEYLKNKFENFYLLAIYATPKTRHLRLEARKERSLTEEAAKKRDIMEIQSLNMSTPIAIADQTIMNEKGIKEMQDQLDEFLQELKKEQQS